MIVLDKVSWWRQLTMVRGSAISLVWPRLLVVLGLSALLTVMHDRFGMLDRDLTPIPFSLVGVALGIFLGFRNNTSYDRYWEGRRLWGQLINTSRSLARQIHTLVDAQPGREAPPPELHPELVRRIVAFVHTLRHHLRDEEELVDARRYLPEGELAAVERARSRPDAVLRRLGERLRDARRLGWIDPLHVLVLEQSLVTLSDIQGSCERIKNTPIPTSYTLLMHRIVAIYVFTLPFGIVAQVGPWTPVVTAFIAYAFLGLDAVGAEIENPFGLDNNDLPLAAISRGIEIELLQCIGVTELPPELQPDKNGLLV